jgi:hypothetical protein
MLYNQYIYKSDIEKAFELGIQHYMINQNRWIANNGQGVMGADILRDLKNFNKGCARKYINQTTGRPIIRYIDPQILFTSPFKQKMVRI